MTPSPRIGRLGGKRCFGLIAAALAMAPWCVHSTLAQPDLTPEAAQAQIADVLSLVSGGMIGPAGNSPQVTRNGDAWRVRVPLPAIATPPDAAIDAIARPLADGVWDVRSLMLPPAGTLSTLGQPNPDKTSTLSCSIGQQANHARIDPSLMVPSPFAMALGNIVIRTDSGKAMSRQSIDRYTMDGTLTGDAARRLTVQSQGAMSNWRIVAARKSGGGTNSSIKSLAVAFGVEGLDRAQALRLRAAAQALAAGRPMDRPEGAGKAPPLTPFQRDQLRAMLDASVGLLTRISAQEMLQGVHFESTGAASGDIGRVEVGLTGEALNDRLNARVDLALHDLTLSSVSTDLAGYVPSRIALRIAATGVRIANLMRLLRHATAPDADPSALQAEALALLSDPQTHVGVERLSFEAGPLHVNGASQVRPLPDGQAAIDIHLDATGLDAMIAQAQGNPAVVQILPIVFLAKGMGRPQGNGLAWDISFADGVVTVNGMPLGGRPGGQKPQP